MEKIKEIINNAGDKVVLLDFYATWCAPCKKMSPIIDTIAEEMSDKLVVIKINTDDQMDVAKEYGVSGLPSLLFVANGEVKNRITGLVSKSQIVGTIESVANEA